MDKNNDLRINAPAPLFHLCYNRKICCLSVVWLTLFSTLLFLLFTPAFDEFSAVEDFSNSTFSDVIDQIEGKLFFSGTPIQGKPSHRAGWVFYHQQGALAYWTAAFVEGIEREAKRSDASLVARKFVQRKSWNERLMKKHLVKMDVTDTQQVYFDFKLAAQVEPHYRFVHFVQRPVDLVTSMIRVAKSGSVAWSKTQRFYKVRENLCTPLEAWEAPMKAMATDNGISDSMLTSLLVQCNELYDKSMDLIKQNNMRVTYANALKILGKDKSGDDYKFAALQLLVGVELRGGGLLYLLHNSHQGNKYTNTLRVFEEDLMGDLATFSRTVACVLQFIDVEHTGVNIGNTGNIILKFRLQGESRAELTRDAQARDVLLHTEVLGQVIQMIERATEVHDKAHKCLGPQ